MLQRVSAEEYADVDAIIDGLINVGQANQLLPSRKYLNIETLTKDTIKLMNKYITPLYVRGWSFDPEDESSWGDVGLFVDAILNMWFASRAHWARYERENFARAVVNIFTMAGIPRNIMQYPYY